MPRILGPWRGGPVRRRERARLSAVASWSDDIYRRTAASRGVVVPARDPRQEIEDFEKELRRFGYEHFHVEHGKNKIVNDGLDAVKDGMFNPATAQAGFFFMAYGADATPETATDTSLGSEIDRVATVYAAGGIGICSVKATFTIAAPVAITERGLFDAGAAGTMFNRKTHGAINLDDVNPDVLIPTCAITLTAP